MTQRGQLSQAEMDALFAPGLMPGDGALPTATPAFGRAADTAAPEPIRPFDVSRLDHLLRGRLPTLDGVNERFARALREGLFSLLGSRVDLGRPAVASGPVQLQKYDAWVRSLAVPAHCNVMAMQPLQGNGMVVCTPELIFAVVDALYGGSCQFPVRASQRAYSATEKRAIHRLDAVLAQAYQAAWRAIYPLLTLVPQRSVEQAQFADLAAPGESVFTTLFQVEIGEITGAIHLCIPYATLQPVRDLVRSKTQGDFMATGVDPRSARALLVREMVRVNATLVARLAPQSATVGQLLSFKVGDFIALDGAPQVQASVEGVPLFEGHCEALRAGYGMRISKSLRDDDLNWMGAPHGG